MIARGPLFAALALGAAVALGGCATTRGDRYDRLLGEVANPSKVIATEIAFAQAARTDGQWTAFRRFAGEGARIFSGSGAIEAAPWLKQQTDPAQAVSWEPHAVWSSCDGSLAVTTGAFAEPGGAEGAFNTVWRRQRDGEYRWVFDFGYPQDRAPAKPERIAAQVADCAAPDAAALPADAQRSVDGTLAWRFETDAAGVRRMTAWIARDGAFAQVLTAAAPAER